MYTWNIFRIFPNHIKICILFHFFTILSHEERSFVPENTTRRSAARHEGLAGCEPGPPIGSSILYLPPLTTTAGHAADINQCGLRARDSSGSWQIEINNSLLLVQASIRHAARHTRGCGAPPDSRAWEKSPWKFRGPDRLLERDFFKRRKGYAKDVD